MHWLSGLEQKLEAKFIKGFTDSNGYQGVTYYLFQKDNKFTITMYHFGTCALCDELIAIEDAYRASHGYGNGSIPLAVYADFIQSMANEANEHWGTKEELINNLHMIFGVGYADEYVQNEVKEFLTNGS
jgi:hypothetical protein